MKTLKHAIVLAALLGSPGVAQSGADSSDAAMVYERTPVFVENRGQWDGDFAYRARFGAMTVFVQENGWTFTLVERRKEPADPDDPTGLRRQADDEVTRGVSVSMSFGSAAKADALVPGPRSPGLHHYFIGNDPSRWRTDVPLYEGVRLAEVWPGIDVGARIEDGHFEYDVFVSPGADLARVSIAVNGADRLRLDSDGALVIETPLGPVRQPNPRSWQRTPDGRRAPVQCDYVVLADDRFGFVAPEWNREQPLVIDPGLIYSTYLGGGSSDVVHAIALDATGAAIVAGKTASSSSFPTTPGAFDTSPNGGWEGFVARLTPDGNALVYSTFLGGGNGDSAQAVALDATGAAIVAGETISATFPTTPGAWDTSFNGGTYDAFVTRLNASGNALVYSTFLGGASADHARAVAVDATGAAIVAGSTASSGFPTTPGAYDTSWNGGWDAFVTRLNASGNALVDSTFMGGGSYDSALAVALDAMGAAAVAGWTQSSDFPTTPGAWDPNWSGPNYDGFVARLSASGDALVYATYLGGGNEDNATAIVVDAAGVATVAGWTESLDFPTTPGAWDTSFNGGLYDGFVTRLSAGGNALVYSTYLGGLGDDYAYAVALDATGAATAAGYAGSANFPTTPGAWDTGFNGGLYDAFVTRLSANGSALVYSTFFGGGSDEHAYAVAVDATGAATVAGNSDSILPTTPGAYDTSWNGMDDAFVARFQIGSFAYPLMAFPDLQSVPVGGTYGLQVVGPPGAPIALLVDPVAINVPVPPYGALGVPFPPMTIVDGIGLGVPGSVPVPLSIGGSGILYFSYGPIPAALAGATFHVQAVSIAPAFPAGAALSTHGNTGLPTPACRADIP